MRCVVTAHPQNLQRDSSAVDITVGGDFLGLCHQRSSKQQGSYSHSGYEAWAFCKSRKRTSVNCAYMQCDHQHCF